MPEIVLVSARFRSLFRHGMFFAGVALGAAAGPLHGQSLPTRLSDEQFWKLVSELSEPTGSFPSENFTSNEVGAQWIIPELLRTVRPGGAYLGVGPEQNFTYIAALQPRIAFIVDIRRQAMLQQLLYKALFEMAPNRAAFLSRLFSRQLPARIGRETSLQAMLETLERIPPDDALLNRTITDVTDRLLVTHRFSIDTDDLEGIRHIMQVAFLAGPHLSYTSGRILGRGAVPMRGSRSRLMVSYRRKPAGVIDTVRFLLVTTPDGLTDTTWVTARPGIANNTVALGPPPSIDDDSLRAQPPQLGGARGDTVMTPPTLAEAAAQLLRGMQLPPVQPFTGAVDFASLMMQSDSTGERRGFLTTEARYTVVRDLQQRNLVVPLVGDFAGRQALRGVGEFLTKYGLTVTAFYTSNVEEYLFQNGVWQGFYQNVAALPVDGSALFLRAFLGGGPRATRSSSGTRVDLALGSIPDLLAAFKGGKITSYQDLLPLSRR